MVVSSSLQLQHWCRSSWRLTGADLLQALFFNNYFEIVFIQLLVGLDYCLSDVQNCLNTGIKVWGSFYEIFLLFSLKERQTIADNFLAIHFFFDANGKQLKGFEYSRKDPNVPYVIGEKVFINIFMENLVYLFGYYTNWHIF